MFCSTRLSLVSAKALSKVKASKRKNKLGALVAGKGTLDEALRHWHGGLSIKIHLRPLADVYQCPPWVLFARLHEKEFKISDVRCAEFLQWCREDWLTRASEAASDDMSRTVGSALFPMSDDEHPRQRFHSSEKRLDGLDNSFGNEVSAMMKKIDAIFRVMAETHTVRTETICAYLECCSFARDIDKVVEWYEKVRETVGGPEQDIATELEALQDADNRKRAADADPSIKAQFKPTVDPERILFHRVLCVAIKCSAHCRASDPEKASALFERCLADVQARVGGLMGDDETSSSSMKAFAETLCYKEIELYNGLVATLLEFDARDAALEWVHWMVEHHLPPDIELCSLHFQSDVDWFNALKPPLRTNRLLQCVPHRLLGAKTAEDVLTLVKSLSYMNPSQQKNEESVITKSGMVKWARRQQVIGRALDRMASLILEAERKRLALTSSECFAKATEIMQLATRVFTSEKCADGVGSAVYEGFIKCLVNYPNARDHAATVLLSMKKSSADKLTPTWRTLAEVALTLTMNTPKQVFQLVAPLFKFPESDVEERVQASSRTAMMRYVVQRYLEIFPLKDVADAFALLSETLVLRANPKLLKKLVESGGVPSPETSLVVHDNAFADVLFEQMDMATKPGVCAKLLMWICEKVSEIDEVVPQVLTEATSHALDTYTPQRAMMDSLGSVMSRVENASTVYVLDASVLESLEDLHGFLDEQEQAEGAFHIMIPFVSLREACETLHHCHTSTNDDVRAMYHRINSVILSIVESNNNGDTRMTLLHPTEDLLLKAHAKNAGLELDLKQNYRNPDDRVVFTCKILSSLLPSKQNVVLVTADAALAQRASDDESLQVLVVHEPHDEKEETMMKLNSTRTRGDGPLNVKDQVDALLPRVVLPENIAVVDHEPSVQPQHNAVDRDEENNVAMRKMARREDNVFKITFEGTTPSIPKAHSPVWRRRRGMFPERIIQDWMTFDETTRKGATRKDRVKVHAAYCKDIGVNRNTVELATNLEEERVNIRDPKNKELLKEYGMLMANKIRRLGVEEGQQQGQGKQEPHHHRNGDEKTKID
eukprot:PhM_4_TR15925/c0_g1_i2/m.54478